MAYSSYFGNNSEPYDDQSQSSSSYFSPKRGGSRKKSTGFSEDLDNSLLKMMGNKAAGGLAALGNVLDLPGSMARDVLAGENPIDQIISPFSGENRATGRDLLRKHGMIGDEDTWGNWAGGLATEIVTDPTNWLTLGGKTLVGKLAQKGGTLAKGVSPGIAAGQRALATLQMPLGIMPEKQIALGTGPLAQKAAGYFDAGKDWVRYSRPVRGAAQLFGAENLGRATKVGQQMGQDIFQQTEKDRQAIMKYTLEQATKLEKAGKIKSDDLSNIRRVIEGVLPATDDATGVAAEYTKKFEDAMSTLKDYGFSDKELDDIVDYSTRRMLGTAGDSRSPKALFNLNNPKSRTREMIFKGFKEGTEGVNRLVKDSKISKIIDTGLANPTMFTKKDIIDAVEAEIKASHGGLIEQFYDVTTRSGKTIKRDRYRGLAKYLVRNTTPEIRQQGLFGNVLADAHGYLGSIAQKKSTADRLYDYMGKNAVAMADPDPKKFTTIKEMLKSGSPGLVLAREDAATGQVYGAVPKIMEMLTGVKPATVDEAMTYAKNHALPKAIADDLTGIWEATKAPPELSKPFKAFKGATNIFKAGVLTHPARYVRDYMGAMARNVEEGAASFKSAKEAAQLVTGGTPKSLVDHPLIKSYLSSQGITSPTPEQAADAARLLIASHLPGDTILSEAGDMAAKVDPTLESILEALPGRGYSGIGSVAKDVGNAAIGKKKDADWNIFNMLSGEKSNFPLFKAGEITGDVVDKAGRATAFLELTRQGWAPEEAARKIGQMQTNYAAKNFTPTENQWMKNLFPFYSFQKSQLGYTLDNLAQSQGGSRLGNIIKASSRQSTDDDPYLPQHVRQASAINLGDKPGDVKSYLTSLGLMHEDPATMIGTGITGDVRGGLLEGLSNLNPAIKWIPEWGLGRTAFQQGPRGGRDLEDLDPPIARTLANISDTITGERTRKVDPIGGSHGAEFLIGNTPISRWLTTARTLTDPRKNALEKALNTLTGARISDVSPGMRDRVKSEYADQLMEDMGADPFEVMQFTKKQEDAMSQEDLIRAKLLESIKAKISADQRARAKEAKK